MTTFTVHMLFENAQELVSKSLSVLALQLSDAAVLFQELVNHVVFAATAKEEDHGTSIVDRITRNGMDIHEGNVLATSRVRDSRLSFEALTMAFVGWIAFPRREDTGNPTLFVGA